MKVLGFFSLLARSTLGGFIYGKAKHFRVCWGGAPDAHRGDGKAAEPWEGPAGGPGSCSVAV